MTSTPATSHRPHVSVTPGHGSTRELDDLDQLLADTLLLAAKTQVFHWNVTGPHFVSLHALFGQQYAELAVAIDLIAERARALGHVVPGSLSGVIDRAVINDAPEHSPSAMDMVRILAEDNLRVALTAARLAGEAADNGDAATADLAGSRHLAHDKAAWMLSATLGE